MTRQSIAATVEVVARLINKENLTPDEMRRIGHILKAQGDQMLKLRRDVVRAHKVLASASIR